MNYLRERVAYVKGLAEGMQISETSNEGKLLRAIIDVLDDIALAVDDIEETQDQQGEQIEDLDQDLAEIESMIFDYEDDENDDDDESYDYNYNTCSCGCDHEHEQDHSFESDEGNEHDLCMVECPYCYNVVVLKKEMFDDEGKTIECPNCHKKIDIEWVCECEDCEEECEDCSDYEENDEDK
ncbi:MAG TPA: hypothetical protein PK733_00795 [Clostridiales bacterium]|nr:hypothetical protein [Clostridiales bacterium]